MKEYTNKELEKLLEKAEELDWYYKFYKQPDGNIYAEMEKYSPAGEDFVMTVYFDDTDPLHSFVESVKKEYENFDPDEHVELWIDTRGTCGAPETIRELVNDADAIKEMIRELHCVLENELYIPFC